LQCVSVEIMDTAHAKPQGQSIAAKAASPKIHALTSVRFFAAFFVVIFHTQWGATPGSFLAKVMALGYIAPNFFFVLSGYILAGVYLRREQPIQVRSFFNSRFARIYPLYYLTLLMTAPFAVMDRAAQYGVKIAIERVAVLLLGSTFMLQIMLPIDKALNIPSWSLAVETVFYLSFPWLGPLLWKLRARATMILMVALCFLCVALDMFVCLRVGDQLPAPRLGSFMGVFVSGILLARWQSIREQEKAGKPRMNAIADWTLLGTSVIAFFGVALANSWLHSHGVSASFVLLPVFLAVIWVLSQSQILPVRLLNAKWLVVLGESSYALYLLQLPVLQLFKLLHLASRARDYPLYLLTAIGLSVLSFYFFETPMRRWILHLLRSRTKETIETASAAQ
jgi:peptidoglycan/LPS O-acetylase OafA/YrhL